MSKELPEITRRNFVKASAALAATATVLRPGYAAGAETLKLGLIGCGGRGTRAAVQALSSTDTPIKIVAMGDVFRDMIDTSEKMLKKGAKVRYDNREFGSLADKFDVAEERKFVGFDAYKKVLATDCDVVILATPPGFRPEHFRAAVEAGKHVFMEKPVAVDPAGVRTVIAAAEEAKKKKLTVVAGTQRRHQKHYIEILKRIHDGAIGDIITATAYWNMGPLWLEEADANWAGKSKWSDMEWQLRNWLFTGWLSGDHICEQHVHNLDIIHWALNANPVKAAGMGGRQARTDPKYGNIYDHFAADLEYPNGIHVTSFCRQMENSPNVIAERIVGSKGVAWTTSEGGFIEGGASPVRFEADPLEPYYQEHADLIASIREGKAVNEGRQVAESTMIAIMSRMSAYTAQDVTWDFAMKESKLELVPKKLEFGPLPLAPVAAPGKTQLV